MLARVAVGRLPSSLSCAQLKGVAVYVGVGLYDMNFDCYLIKHKQIFKMLFFAKVLNVLA